MQMRSAIFYSAVLVTLAVPAFAQSSGGGVMATTSTSGINSMAITPVSPPGITTSGIATTNPSQPSEPSRQTDADGKDKHRPTDAGANPPQK